MGICCTHATSCSGEISLYSLQMHRNNCSIYIAAVFDSEYTHLSLYSSSF